MEKTELVVAYLLDGAGGGKQLGWPDIETWKPEQGCLWIHLDMNAEDSRQWLREQSGLNELVVDALLAESTRPRCRQIGAGTMLFLRGVNLNPGADPEDMVSIRLWIEASRVVSVRLRRLISVDDLVDAIDRGQGPVDAGDFVAQLAERLSSRMAGAIDDIEDEVDQLQVQALEPKGSRLRSELTRVRREIITLRRYLAPQRDALARLTQLKNGWLRDDDSLYLQEEADRVARYVEDLDAARERTSVTQEELASRLSEQMNSRMYALSVVAGIFLPLGFLTGLFGINVGGIPWANNPYGFRDIAVMLGVVTIVQIFILRWRKWF